MDCSHHPGQEVIGYCHVCAEFGCEECLTKHEGNFYCKKHYEPIAAKLKRQKEIQHRQSRHRLVVHFKDGRIERGICYDLNPKTPSFHLEHMTEEGESAGTTKTVRYSEVKGVFHVKSYDGKYDKHEKFPEWKPEGPEVVVEFTDGERIHAHTLNRYDAEAPRFWIVPHNPKSNNIRILVEASAVKQVYSIEEYKQMREEERRKQKESSDASTLSKEETMGDFYFETRNYEAAALQYEQAYKRHPDSKRLFKKMLAAEYNMGVQYIKRRDYKRSLKWMQRVLDKDPDNKHAKKKVLQLNKILEKMAAAGTEAKPSPTKIQDLDLNN